MADSDESKTPGADAKASSSPSAEKPARGRSRAAAKPAGEKPARARASAKKADAAEAPAKKAEAAEVPAKTPRARTAAKKVEEAPAKAPRARAAAKKPAAEGAGAAAAAEAAKAAPAPAPAKSRRPLRAGSAAKESARPVPVGLTVMARARYVRSSARKARLVCDHIRGKSVPEARAVLAFAPRGVAKDWAKLLDSAIANAENNHELVGDELHITSVYADEGPTLKRFTPRAMGRATPIHKRTSHLTIMLGSKE
jgi:ribosomal protein L22